jgi:hypothetical protein
MLSPQQAGSQDLFTIALMHDFIDSVLLAVSLLSHQPKYTVVLWYEYGNTDIHKYV